MPIVFQPASPAGSFPGLEMQAGAGQAAVQGLPSLQRAISDLVQSYNQRAASQQQGAIAAAHLNEQARQFDLGQQGAVARFNAQAQQEADQQASAQQQQAYLQDQHFQNQLQLMALEPTQRDAMRRVQLRGALSDIADYERQGIITSDQAAEARAKTMGYLGPIEEQAARWQAGQREAMAQARNEEAARARELWNMQQGDQLGFWHKTANQLAGVPNPQPGGIRSIDVLDGEGNVIGNQVLSPEGKTHFVPRERGGVADKPLDLNAIFKNSYAEARAQLTRLNKDGTEIPPGPTEVQSLAEELMRRQVEFHRQHGGTTSAGLGSQMAPAPRSSDAPVAPSPVDVAQRAVETATRSLFGGSDQPARAPVVPTSEADAKPYAYDKPVTPAQIQATETWKSLDQRLKAAFKPSDPEYRRLSNLIFSAASLHRQTGGYAKMNEKERVRYNSDLQQINEGFKSLTAPKPAQQYYGPDFGAIPPG